MSMTESTIRSEYIPYCVMKEKLNLKKHLAKSVLKASRNFRIFFIFLFFWLLAVRALASDTLLGYVKMMKLFILWV